MPTIKPIIIVQGGQWGSEAKGAVTAMLVSRRDVDYIVRTGAVNAGHTFYHRGIEYKMQQIPCGFHHPKTQLIIGAGAMINPTILAKEIKMINESIGGDIRDRLIIDFRAGIHLENHQNAAKLAGRHHKMGATGKGCSEAITAKIRERGEPNVLLFKDWLYNWGDEELEVGPALVHYLHGLQYADTEELLNNAYDTGNQILLEATQGTLLDLHLGPYPYTTHKQSIASQWVTEAGLSPALEYEIVSVCRTYPIRVAGNSGPMPNEISWVNLARRINSKLEKRGFPPMVAEAALEEFERAALDIAQHKYGLQNYSFHMWSDSERVKHRVAVSELHRDALLAVGAATLAELRKLFEMTTVTKKLRRIADWDADTMQASTRQNRPTYVVLTFLNYEFPQYWGETHADVVMADPDVRDYIKWIEDAWSVVVRYVSTGPNSEHLLDVKHGLLKAEVKSAHAG